MFQYNPRLVHTKGIGPMDALLMSFFIHISEGKPKEFSISADEIEKRTGIPALQQRPLIDELVRVRLLKEDIRIDGSWFSVLHVREKTKTSKAASRDWTEQEILAGDVNGSDDEIGALVIAIARRWRPRSNVISVVDSATKKAWKEWTAAGGTADVALKVAIGMQLDDWDGRGENPPTIRMIMKQSPERISRFVGLYEKIMAGAKPIWPKEEDEPDSGLALARLREFMSNDENMKLIGWWRWGTIKNDLESMTNEDAREWIRVIAPDIKRARANMVNGLPPRQGSIE